MSVHTQVLVGHVLYLTTVTNLGNSGTSVGFMHLSVCQIVSQRKGTHVEAHLQLRGITQGRGVHLTARQAPGH